PPQGPSLFARHDADASTLARFISDPARDGRVRLHSTVFDISPSLSSGLRHIRSPPDLAESGKTTEEQREYAAAGIRVGHKPDGACNVVGEGGYRSALGNSDRSRSR